MIGSHLVPLMYFAMHLFYFCLNNVDSEKASCNMGLGHVLFSTCGGLAFVISYTWLNFSGQKQRKNNVDESPKCHEEIMQLCWKVYLVFLFAHQAFSASQSPCLLFGLLHIFMIFSYSQKALTSHCSSNTQHDQKQWQDAFTCGEWMVVSNLTTTLVGDFVVHLYKSTNDYNSHALFLPENIRIAQAGLAGSVIGVACCQLTSGRVLLLGVFGTLAGMFGIVVGCLELELSFRKHEERMSFLPKSAQWIIQFLSNELDVEVGGDVIHFQRYIVLGYWSFVLIASIPLTVRLCAWVEAGGIPSQTQHTLARKKRRVITARKFFHFVGALLFTPVTWLDSDMMALSYAIAIALLMILEIIRCFSLGRQQKSGISLSLNAFYRIFLDEKDSLAADGGLAITHITLILGCAIPLWAYKIVNITDDSRFLTRLFPYVGVLVLGVGDSAGAVAGIIFGRHSWPGSSRTIEGSCCMFVSMVICLYLAGVERLSHVLSTLAMVTLLEAATSQIDNLCLPLAGTTLVALAAINLGSL